MSNVKIGNNTYSGIKSIRLMNADNSGYAEYVEGADAGDALQEQMFSGAASLGDITSDATSCWIGWLSSTHFGTLSLPQCVSLTGGIQWATGENVLIPNAQNCASFKGGGTADYRIGASYNGISISGTLDISGLTTWQNAGAMFQYASIGTLKLGAFTGGNDQRFSSATIGNLVWNVSESAVPDDKLKTLLNKATSIANLYIPSNRVTAISALVGSGDITKVTNVLSIDDWSEES